MIDTERDGLLAALAELARRHPHWRFGQLVSNVAGWSNAEVWDVEDDALASAARKQLERALDPQARGLPARELCESA